MLWPKYLETPQNINLVHRYGERILYTDGSYDHGVSGWAVVEGSTCVWQDWSRGLTSNLAEGLAIQAALEMVETTAATVFTDSLAWVNALSSKGRLKGRPSKKVFDDCMDLLHKDIQLVWVPSHTGNFLGNELADCYARDARLRKVQFPH